jgi:hypothetical protein
VAGAPEIPSIIADKFSYFFARACSSLTSAIFPTENRVAPPPPSISCASVSGSRHRHQRAGKRMWAALVTVAGTSSGNAVLLIALGLGWILTHALTWFEMVRFVGAGLSDLARHPGLWRGLRSM